MSLDLNVLFQLAVEKNASDIHLTVDSPPVVRVDGTLISLNKEKPLSSDDLERIVSSLLTPQQMQVLSSLGETDFSYSIQGLGRFRINTFRQRGSFGIAARFIPSVIPTPEDLRLPSICLELARIEQGLILVTGPTGSGKSTTLASLIDYINRSYAKHIVTIEDPIEYLHSHHRSIVNQREVGTDTVSFQEALRAALRQDPDVILVGEMRDVETISTALMAAETGHLVFSTLHTKNTTQAIDRIIDAFPPHSQQQIRTQLATVLQGIVSQQLLPRIDGNGRIAAFEILIANSAVQNLIRESKTFQLPTVIQTSSRLGMQSMEKSIQDMLKRGLIRQGFE